MRRLIIRLGGIWGPKWNSWWREPWPGKWSLTQKSQVSLIHDVSALTRLVLSTSSRKRSHLSAHNRQTVGIFWTRTAVWHLWMSICSSSKSPLKKKVPLWDWEAAVVATPHICAMLGRWAETWRRRIRRCQCSRKTHCKLKAGIIRMEGSSDK